MNRKLFTNMGLMVVLIFSGYIFSACSKAALPQKELTAEEKLKKDGYEALEAKKTEYTTIPAKEQLVKEPYMKKKLILYRFDSTSSDSDKWLKNDFGTDKFGARLSTEAREKMEYNLAKNPDEVGIIALLPECKSVNAGSYGSTAAAFRESCELILIDPELSAVVYRTTFEGELESSKYVGASEKNITGKVDGMKIVDFLANLRTKSDDSPTKKPNKK